MSNHVACDISGERSSTVRPGAFQPGERTAGGGQIVDKTSVAMEELTNKAAGRFIEIVEAEMGDVDITRSDIWFPWVAA